MNGWLELVASAAFMAGLLGGVHCAAMCGSIIAACAPRESRGAAARWRLALGYNAGRIASYMIAGALAGAFGKGALALRGSVPAQQIMLVGAGASMLLLALYLSGARSLAHSMEAVGSVVWRRIQPYSRAFLPADTVPKAIGLGAVWGWLPCGMVYGALIPALASGDAVYGAFMMLAFGAGTLPNVLGLALLSSRLGRFLKMPAVRASAAIVIAIAGILALFKAGYPAAMSPDGLLCRIFPALAH